MVARQSLGRRLLQLQLQLQWQLAEAIDDGLWPGQERRRT